MMPAMPARRTAPIPNGLRKALAAAALAAVLVGCSQRETEPLQVTEEEQAMLTHLTRDSFVRVTGLQRNDEGRLVVTTQQGNTTVRYQFAPENAASKQLRIRRMAEEFELKVGASDQLGTGPEPRR
jgi:hypothetical protein